MNGEGELRDQYLLQEVSRITNEYGVLHRNAVRDLARIRTELSQAHSVLGTVAHALRPARDDPGVHRAAPRRPGDGPGLPRSSRRRS